MICLFREAVPLEEQQQAFIPGRLAGADHRFGAGADFVPDLRPDFPAWTTERPGMLGAERHLVIGAVVEESDPRPLPDPHGVAGAEHRLNGGLKTDRPRLDRPDRGFPPVELTSELPHLTPLRSRAREVPDSTVCGHWQ